MLICNVATGSVCMRLSWKDAVVSDRVRVGDVYLVNLPHLPL